MIGYFQENHFLVKSVSHFTEYIPEKLLIERTSIIGSFLPVSFTLRLEMLPAERKWLPNCVGKCTL